MRKNIKIWWITFSPLAFLLHLSREKLGKVIENEGRLVVYFKISSKKHFGWREFLKYSRLNIKKCRPTRDELTKPFLLWLQLFDMEKRHQSEAMTSLFQRHIMQSLLEPTVDQKIGQGLHYKWVMSFTEFHHKNWVHCWCLPSLLFTTSVGGGGGTTMSCRTKVMNRILRAVVK